MLKYLTVILDDSCPSICCYSTEGRRGNLMPLDTLKKAIRFALMENLSVQVVFPQEEMPQLYYDALDDIEYVSIASDNHHKTENYDVIVSTCVSGAINVGQSEATTIICNTCFEDFMENYSKIDLRLFLNKRLNLILTNILYLSVRENQQRYENALSAFAQSFVDICVQNKAFPSINIITDRLFLKEMNNCNSGVESVTICPDGNIYPCPAFNGSRYSIGDVDNGIIGKNLHLYRLNYAPICERCDAYHCTRCVWQNKLLTREINIPSAEQCIKSHIERRVISKMSAKLASIFAGINPINDLEYLDPIQLLRQ